MEDPPPVSDVMPSHFQTPADLCGFDITISWTVSRLYVTRSEKSQLPRTQQQDTLFTIKQ